MLVRSFSQTALDEVSSDWAFFSIEMSRVDLEPFTMTLATKYFRADQLVKNERLHINTAPLSLTIYTRV